MDILSELLSTLRLNASIFLHATFCNIWVVDISSMKSATFHVVASGNCWLHMPESKPVLLNPGDLLFLPLNSPHQLSYSAELPREDVPRNQPATIVSGPSASLICGQVEFCQDYWNPLLEALPKYIVLPTARLASTNLGNIIDSLIQETSARNSGTGVVLNRLSDLLFIEIVRFHVSHQHDSSYLAAVGDDKLSRALAAFHRAPGDNWSVQTLAEAANMSRSAFADRFQQLTGISPMHYVTRWRMEYGRSLLTGGRESVARIAELCGYGSEEAFAKAVRKEFGKSPRELRKGQIDTNVAQLVSVSGDRARSTKILYSSMQAQALKLQEAVLFVDVRRREDYERGHIPDAINLPALGDMLITTKADGIRQMESALAVQFARAGISREKTVVFYEDNLITQFGVSCRAYFLLSLFGHPNIGVLDGGLERWRRDGYAVSTTSIFSAPCRFDYRMQLNELATVDDVLDAISDPRVKLLDDRDADEWIGTVSAPTATYGADFTPRKGRIPGACWIEWRNFMENVDGISHFKDPDRIQAISAQAGLYPDDDIIVYCFKGSRSANTFVALKTAGFKHVRNYLGSWNEWSREPSLPVMSMRLAY